MNEYTYDDQEQFRLCVFVQAMVELSHHYTRLNTLSFVDDTPAPISMGTVYCFSFNRLIYI